MKILASALILLVVALHCAFLVLEMFLWDGPIGQRIFGLTAQQSSDTAVLAMNQGLYNGFLAAGLFWGWLKDKFEVIVFFLGCVIVAGIFGAVTVKSTIFFTQALPAILALLAATGSRTRT